MTEINAMLKEFKTDYNQVCLERGQGREGGGEARARPARHNVTRPDPPFFLSHTHTILFSPPSPPHTTTPPQTHFVRNETFKKAADSIQGPARKIFIEFLERSCTAEFSGFLLYKELARRLKKSNPAVAEIFALLSRDEARHAGFINKALADFNLALDLGFLTKNRTYT